MTILTTSKRKKLKTSQFALPSKRKYPINDEMHAINAKARATQMVKKGKLSASQAKMIKAKADRLLKKR